MAAETIRARFDRRADRSARRWAPAWPGLLGSTLCVIDCGSLLFADHHRAMGPTLGMLAGLGLFPCALGCVTMAVSERPQVRRRALLANGIYLLLAAAEILVLSP